MTGPDALIAIGVIACLAILLAMWMAIASLRNRTNSDDGDQGADSCGAEEGGIINHSQPIRTGSERNHG